MEKILKISKKALIIGVGGGGDVVSSLVVSRLFECHNIICRLGGVPWEQPEVDTKPGPRKYSEVKNVKQIHEYAWIVNKDTMTIDNVKFTESIVSEYINESIVHIDLNGGVLGIVDAMMAVAMVFDIDLFVGIDVGGDSLANGTEQGLKSPLADSMMLSAFKELMGRGYMALWGVIGYGCDGELTDHEIDNAISVIAKHGGYLGAWGITKSIVSEIEKLLEIVPSQASAIPIKSAKGYLGVELVRGKEIKLRPINTIIFLLDPEIIYDEVSLLARVVSNSSTLEMANKKINDCGVLTELDYERLLQWHK